MFFHNFSVHLSQSEGILRPKMANTSQEKIINMRSNSKRRKLTKFQKGYQNPFFINNQRKFLLKSLSSQLPSSQTFLTLNQTSSPASTKKRHKFPFIINQNININFCKSINFSPHITSNNKHNINITNNQQNHYIIIKTQMNKYLSATLTFTFLLLIIVAPSFSQQIQTMTLFPAKGVEDSHPQTMYNINDTPPFNIRFLHSANLFNCSLTALYTYTQDEQAYRQDLAYLVVIKMSGLGQEEFMVTMGTVYSILHPQVNGSNSLVCAAADECILQIKNGCPSQLSFFQYFDIVTISIQGMENQFSYNVYCNENYLSNTFQWGLLIMIIFSTILILIVARYSKAWSLAGKGVAIRIKVSVIFNIIIIIGGIIAAFSFQAISIAVIVLSWIFGTLGVWLCMNQILYLIDASFLRIKIISIKKFKIRIMQVISFLVGVGVCIGWWFSNKNFIVNDILAICMTVAAIKFFKFTSLRYAVICFTITIIVEIIFICILELVVKVSYNSVFLNVFNNPFQLQMPTINPVFNEKCSWLPITDLIYPGCLMAYLRRFDTSRNTNVYLITSGIIFLVGSLVWMFISIASPISLPFGLIAEPATLACVAIFAWRRMEIRTLWTGKYYDEEFANKEGIKKLQQIIHPERENSTSIVYDPQMFQGLQLKDDESCIQSKKSKFTRKISQMSEIAIKSQQASSKINANQIPQDNNIRRPTEMKNMELSDLLAQNDNNNNNNNNNSNSNNNDQ